MIDLENDIYMNEHIVQNLGPVGNQKFPAAVGAVEKPILNQPIGAGVKLEYLLENALNQIRERDERIAKLTNLLLAQSNITMLGAPTVESVATADQNKVNSQNNRWLRVKQALERKYAKVPERYENFESEKKGKSFNEIWGDKATEAEKELAENA